MSPLKTTIFKSAIAQIDSHIGDIDRNIDRHLENIERAKSVGAQLIVFPELGITGYSVKDLAWEIAIDPLSDSRFRRLKEASKEMSIVIGYIERGSDHGVYNSALFLEDGEIRHIHRKVYPPTYGMFEEGRYFSAGRTVAAFNSRLGRIGLLVCEDVWHPSLPYLLSLDGAEIFACLAASPTRISNNNGEMEVAEVNHEHHRSYARLFSSYFLWCNRVGVEDGVSFYGASSITGPTGRVLAVGKTFEADLITAEIDISHVARARKLSRHLLDENPDFVKRELERIVARREGR